MVDITCVIVDDEDINIKLLKTFITRNFSNLNIIGEATSVSKALFLLKKKQPDILFLDVQLNNSTSFSLLDQLGKLNSKVIIISSFNNYAIKAIKYKVDDYILKPVDEESFVTSIASVISQITNENKKHQKGHDFLAISTLSEIKLIKVSQILYLKSKGRFTIFFLDCGEEIEASINIGEYELSLKNNLFFRVHHQYIVNVSRIQSIINKDESYCLFKNDFKIPIAKRRLDEFIKFLQV